VLVEQIDGLHPQVPRIIRMRERKQVGSSCRIIV
jgi:hypothetical protein